jgi:hypothetical protein
MRVKHDISATVSDGSQLYVTHSGTVIQRAPQRCSTLYFHALQVALLVVMAQIGCYVPATFMSLRCVGRVCLASL